MIEFTAQADIEAVESVLVEVGSSGSFTLKPDRFIKSTSAYKKYVLLSNHSDRVASKECGSIELVRKKDNLVFIKINTSTIYSEDDSIAISVDRFFYLLTQRLLQERMVTV